MMRAGFLSPHTTLPRYVQLGAGGSTETRELCTTTHLACIHVRMLGKPLNATTMYSSLNCTDSIGQHPTPSRTTQCDARHYYFKPVVQQSSRPSSTAHH